MFDGRIKLYFIHKTTQPKVSSTNDKHFANDLECDCCVTFAAMAKSQAGNIYALNQNSITLKYLRYQL